MFPLLSADGEYRWFLSRAEPIRADDGSILRWFAIHELATNALKYGSISSDEGEISVAWAVVGDDAGGPRLRLSWVETGVPPVTPPSRRGLGTIMFEHSPRIALGATVTPEYLSAGFRWTVEAPVGLVLVD